MKASSDLFYDEKNRPVYLVEDAGKTYKYYLGQDVQGIILEDELGEYILVNYQKRYWRGVIDTLPSELERLDLPYLGFIVLKPDCILRDLESKVISRLSAAGIKVLASDEGRMTSEDVHRLYPFFHTRQWEAELVAYMTSERSRYLLVSTKNAIGDLVTIRNKIREEFKNADKPSRLVNVIHASDTPRQALHEASLFFPSEVLLNLGE